MSVRHALLGLLRQGARHGYELHVAMSALSGELWDVKPAQVYATLERLSEQGLVREQPSVQAGGPQRRPFELTDAGLDELKHWFSMPVKQAHERDEFFLKLMLAITTGVESPLKVLHTQRASLYRDLHELLAQRTDAATLSQSLQLDQAVMHVEADLRWLDVVEGRLDEMAKAPLPVTPARPRGRPRKHPLPEGEP